LLAFFNGFGKGEVFERFGDDLTEKVTLLGESFGERFLHRLLDRVLRDVYLSHDAVRFGLHYYRQIVPRRRRQVRPRRISDHSAATDFEAHEVKNPDLPARHQSHSRDSVYTWRRLGMYFKNHRF